MRATKTSKRVRPICRKRVYVDKERSTWFYACLFPSKEALNRYSDQFHPGSKKKQAAGAFLSYDRYDIFADGSQKLKPDFGELLLYPGGCGYGILTHELQHAVFAWCRRVGIDPSDCVSDDSQTITPESGEERVCWTIGYFAYQMGHIINSKTWIRASERSNYEYTPPRTARKVQKPVH